MWDNFTVDDDLYREIKEKGVGDLDVTASLQ